MKFPSMKLAGALLASFALVSAGPAWSATATPKEKTKTVAKQKAKTVAKQKVKAKARSRAQAKTSKPAEAVVTAALPAVAVVAAPAAVAAVPEAETVAHAQSVYVPSKPLLAVNPYLAYQQQPQPQQPQQQPQPPRQQSHQQPVQPVAAANPWDNVSRLGSNLKSLLPSIPEGQSILPSIKKVYPTGEKPLVVLTFKCPTELIGITPIPTKLLHDGVNGVFDLVNATDLLSFNLQQVCQ